MKKNILATLLQKIFEKAQSMCANIRYFSRNFGHHYGPLNSSITRYLEQLFNYIFHHGHNHHVWYRPAQLKGRHIVDVMRAVCGPADVSEAELDELGGRRRRSAGLWFGQRVVNRMVRREITVLF